MSESKQRPWTMQQIATAAGVSVTTVSHALSGKRPVSPSTAMRIRRIVDEFGYAPNASGQQLKTGRTQVIGLAVPDISHYYFSHIAKAVEEAADELDYGVITASTFNADPRREKRCFNMLRTGLIDGLIYTASRERVPTDELARAASRSHIVLADEAIPSLGAVPSVTSDDHHGGHCVATYLASLGHSRVVIISGFPGLASQVERVRGMREVFPHALVLHGDFEMSSGYRLISDLLAQNADFTAVLTCNDLMAVGAIRRLVEAGRRIPDDVSVTGYDDIDMAEVVTPPLTTVRQNTSEIGRRSARMLIDALDADPDMAQSSVLLPAELVVRASTARPRN
ncbi:LacI family DNA-binding transcriptional regulator [Gordonia sp. DT30]|uniref:LacI family DNA-binding transcriptional regulator n=1 Tax=unclassified Gordonia (in: high G+C Gram-positive bacteria) TaxID=2657482 RepID=UPI003CF1D748